LGSKEAILQANTTVIAGALILLTLTSLPGISTESEARTILFLIAAVTIVPFAFSSALLIAKWDSNHIQRPAGIVT
jgi:hypothetical protein